LVKLQPDVCALSNPQGAMIPTVRWPPERGSAATVPVASEVALQLAMAAVVTTTARIDNPRFMSIPILFRI
jgi:hypothetical protein